MNIMTVRTVPPFTAAEYASMAAEQAAAARKLREAGNPEDADIWQAWSEQTAGQAASAPGFVPPLTEDEWDGE